MLRVTLVVSDNKTGRYIANTVTDPNLDISAGARGVLELIETVMLKSGIREQDIISAHVYLGGRCKNEDT